MSFSAKGWTGIRWVNSLLDGSGDVAQDLLVCLQGFSSEGRDVFEHFEFKTQIERLSRAGLLYQVTEKFCQINLHPNTVSNADTSTVFEELIRKFAKLSNETAGEHFTSREVIRLMVGLLFIGDAAALPAPGLVDMLYDPTVCAGGMLKVAGEYLAEHNPRASLVVYGQELDPVRFRVGSGFKQHCTRRFEDKHCHRA